MEDFAKGKPAERQPYFEETAARRDSTTTAVEKDFWICWTLSAKYLPTLGSSDAAAIQASSVRPEGAICEDQRLAKAAESAGFSVLELSRVVPGTLAIRRNS